MLDAGRGRLGRAQHAVDLGPGAGHHRRVLAQQVQHPGQQGGAGVVPGDEHGQNLVADEVVGHPLDADKLGQQVVGRLRRVARRLAGQLRPPLADDGVEVSIQFVQRGLVAEAGQVGQDDPQTGRDVLDGAQDGPPQPFHVWAELHVDQRAHEDEQRQAAHLDQHVARRAVGPAGGDAVGVGQHGRYVVDDLRLQQHRLHVAAQPGVALAVFDEHAVAQQLGHRVGLIAEAQVLALRDHDLAIAVRPNHDRRLEAGQGDAKGRADLVAHDRHGRQQRAIAGQAAQDVEAGLRLGLGQGAAGGHINLPGPPVAAGRRARAARRRRR
jgi:hypothetical protein